MPKDMAFYLLELATIGSLFGSTATVAFLEPESRISIKHGALLTAFGFVFFISIFELLNQLILGTVKGNKICQKYNISNGDVMDINNKVVSAIQGIFCCVTGSIVCFWSCSRDILLSSHFMSEAYAWFGAAYFFYDIWSMYKVHLCMNYEKENLRDKYIKKTLKNGDTTLSAGDGVLARKPNKPISFFEYCKYEPVILMHHIFIGGFGFLVMVYLRGDLGDCVFGFVYLMELSTPFVSIRGILSRLKMKETSLYVVNGIVMLITFFFCRVASLPYVMLMYSNFIQVSYLEAIESLPIGCKISIAILLLPQIYWFYLMSMGAIKVFFPPSKKRVYSSGDSKKTEKTS